MKIYMFPMMDIHKSASRNPYIEDLVGTLEENGCIIVNKNKINRYGVLDLLFYLGKTDAYYFNWIENLSDRRFGLVQTAVFVLIFFILKLFGKRVIWMMHNKISHSKKSLWTKLNIFYLLINHSDMVLTHSREGVAFGNSFLKNSKKIWFRHHPVKNRSSIIDHSKRKNIDILIWGSISPYKGIDSFLDHLKEYDIVDRYKIHIVGKVTDDELRSKLQQFQSKNIIIEDSFVSTKRLEELFETSKIVLFTYAGYSTLASGALMDTLSYRKSAIGPNAGVFRELAEDGIITTFRDLDDLLGKLDIELSMNTDNAEVVEKFIKNNGWKEYGEWLCRHIKQVL